MPDYKVGSVIEYATLTGAIRRVRVTAKLANVKNDRPGFDGKQVFIQPGQERNVWGYDSQITRVISNPVETAVRRG